MLLSHFDGTFGPQHSILVRILLVTLFWDTLYISVLNAKLHHQTKYKGFFWPQNVLPRKFSGRNGLSPSQFRHYPSTSTARVFKSTRLRCQRGPGIKLSCAWGQLSCPHKYKMIPPSVQQSTRGMRNWRKNEHYQGCTIWSKGGGGCGGVRRSQAREDNPHPAVKQKTWKP